ncbi:winged helix-turn-helix transcriptional regulator [Croceibacterium ferulae]|uniref:winged helix-turn-helix transcriptional regulator n=1 Tax=Croceibacterium ferulae TaxID=1854641 RepID=UPI000EB1DD18|nr:helix-turn-helix domain-containing protein [Croceibacterium ferulae]
MGKRPDYTAATAAQGVQDVIDIVNGRWKLVILFQLFGGKVLRFSALERAIPGISQKMLAQQLRQLERDGVIARTIHNEVPPRVEYHLTAWGQQLCPALDSLLIWREAASLPVPEEPPTTGCIRPLVDAVAGRTA